MNPNGDATLHRRGSEKLIDRWIASGSMKSLVTRVMREEPQNRRQFIIMYDGMEFQAAEIKNLAGQYAFSENFRQEDTKSPVLRRGLTKHRY